MPKSNSFYSRSQHRIVQKEDRFLACQKSPTRNERLKKIHAEIDFVHSLPTYFAAAWSNTAARSWSERPVVVRTCHFLRLPTELRVVIYDYVLRKPYTIEMRQQSIRSGLPLTIGPALLRVSKAIRYEALPIYFRANEFLLHAPLAALDMVGSWLERITLHSGRKSFYGLRFQMQRCHWMDLPQVKRLVQLLASGKLKLDVSGIDLSAPMRERYTTEANRLVSVNSPFDRMNMQGALEEAIVLGTTAWKQRWSARKLSMQLEVLMVLKMPLDHLKAHKESRKPEARPVNGSGYGIKRRQMES